MDTEQKRLEFIQAMTGKTVWQGYLVRGAESPLIPILRKCTLLSVYDVIVPGDKVTSWGTHVSEVYSAIADTEMYRNGVETTRGVCKLIFTGSGEIYLDGIKCYQLEAEAKRDLVDQVADKVQHMCKCCMYELMGFNHVKGGQQ